ncbi:terminase large subunit [Bradyrhizobium sp. CCBAU 51753]|uniref:terminase large subunit n=1 Tax=Bradyrhizobium sp. CCBAU 51753 TaxID=1325100 RepID=UPI00188A8163|nr:terminase TerL endonuclease subunit [Bradyrhizobium sp. CCBAU 51753]QOZ26163.1 terminase large subunit [Bradyrhizobium sp. CCBAU 51753]
MTTRSPSKDTFPHWIYDGSPIADPMGYGERAVTFLRRLKHPKSKLPKKAFCLDPWQERIVRRIYGPRNDDGSRIVATVVILVPRGNRKTSLSAALALLHTFGPEKVEGGEVIFAASDRKQAGIAFREATGIVKADPKHLVPVTKIYDAFNSAKKISYPRAGVELEVISSDAPSQEGRTPAFVLADEIHVWRGDLLWKVLTNGLDKTDDTLLVVATTAGRGQDNIAWDVIDRARKIARGEIVDPTVLPILFESDPDCDYTDEDHWRRVNPGSAHGYPSIAGFRRHLERAKTSPTERASLLQYKLNVWLDHSTSPFVDMAIYDQGAAPVDYEALRGQPCWVAVDMSRTTDLSAVVACFKDGDTYIVLPHFFCPEADIGRRGDVDGVNYKSWANEGFLTATSGNVIDDSAIVSYVRSLADRFIVREVGFDATYAQAVMRPLQDDGFEVVTIRQGWVTQSPALNLVEAAIISRKFKHGGHPILRWNFANVAIETDKNSNRTIHKGKSTDRIDGVAATWMAVSRAAAGDTGPSLWDDPTLTPGDFVS